MKIDRRLNLVVEIARDDGTKLYAHSASLPREVFQQYWDLAGRTMNALFTRDFGVFAPRFARDMLLQVAKEMGGKDPRRQQEELARVENGFLAEIRRLTNVFALTKDKGWTLIPLDAAKSEGVIDEDEAEELDTSIVYFTCASRTFLKSQREELRGALSVLGAQISSLDCTAFKTSLTTSTAAENSGETATPS